MSTPKDHLRGRRDGYKPKRTRAYDYAKTSAAPIENKDYWCGARSQSERFAAALRASGMLERVETGHSGELPITIRGQVGQVTSYNALPARSK